jgi:hypothetical protein
MQVRTRSVFPTIRSEGALLPPDLLRRVHGADKDLKGLTPEAYHLPGGMRLNEAASRAWNALFGAWTTFREARDRLREGDPGTSITRERWLLPLFQELNYGRLQTRLAEEMEGKSYPISHGWGPLPVHLVGHNVDLDRRTSGVAGASRSSPHSLVQEYLNRSDSSLWGVVSNGLKLRLLRDNLSLTRQAYVEFDLEAMMEGEVYADFVLLFLVLHQSRVESDTPEACLLEAWSKDASDVGARALDSLRVGVENAIAALGQGFLAHPANEELKRKLRDGELSGQDYYRQLLRLVYRLLFLFVAEDRNLLHTPDASDEAKARYTYYSTRRLRDHANDLRGGRHADLYESLKVVMRRLGNEGERALGLPALGSYLFSEGATPDLFSAQLPNNHFLQAVRALAYAEVSNVQRAVDYKNMGSEELGSVYESLLELYPKIDTGAATFVLNTASGNERKTTGSYYTPASLIRLLLDSTLDPVIEKSIRGKNAEKAEQAILNLKVVDPACGSGHFLIAAAQRLAKRLAAIRTGDEEPAPEASRHALRDVISRSIYGVDINEMSSELCKVALWMEALEPGKPLTFLEHRIRVGNSLLGSTPDLIASGLPDDAFNPIEGDDKKIASAAKKRNREEQRGQTSLFESAPVERRQAIAQGFAELSILPDDSPEQTRVKEARLEHLLQDERYAALQLTADAWCAAFVWSKKPGYPPAITTGTLRRLRERSVLDEAQGREVERITRRYNFFHWHLAFPEVFPPNRAGGFDVVLGNPPWERIKIQEKEWFASRNPEIANARNASERGRMIRNMEESDPSVYKAFLEDKRKAEGESHFARTSGSYPLTGRGDVNTYPLFAELGRSVQSPNGRMGMILPSGIATDATTQYFFQDLVETQTLAALYSFENEELIFKGVHHAFKFCLFLLTGQAAGVQEMNFIFFARQPEAIQDPNRVFTLTPEDIFLLNPNTKTCPVFRGNSDAEITRGIYRRVPVLVNEVTRDDPWGIRLMTMFHMSNDSGLFKTREQLEPEGFILHGNHFVRGNEVFLPLYEAKMFQHYDHRFGTYDNQTEAQSNQGKLPELTTAQHQNPMLLPYSRYWLKESDIAGKLDGQHGSSWLLAYRWITNATSERTFISAPIPIAGVGNSAPIIEVSQQNAPRISCLVSNLSAFVFDYVSRQKLGGNNMTFGVAKQLPVLPPFTYTLNDVAFITSHALELSYTAWDLQPFAQDLGYDGPPFIWNEMRRFLLRAELDALYFHLYGLERGDVDSIMETFPIIKRKDEAKYGCYQTKEVILEIYDEMARCKAEGREYRTRLNPPPASPLVAHPEFKMLT